MTNRYLQILTISFLFLILTGAVWAQKVKTPNKTTEIELITDDSTMIIQVYKGNNVINTQYPLYYYWYNKGKLGKTQDGYAGNLLHGKTLVYNKKHILIRSESYEYGLPTGSWKCWYTDGTLRYSQEWKKGLPNGNWNFYSAKGQLQRSMHYNKGFLSGKYIEYIGDSCVVKQYAKGIEKVLRK